VTVEIVYELLVVLHFLGLASLIGGWLVQVRGPERRVLPAMLHGALTQLVTGLLIVGLGESVLDAEYDYAKIATKLVVAAVVLVLCWANRRKEVIPTGVYALIGGLAIANVLVAVLWATG
jgi:hypothetical protein